MVIYRVIQYYEAYPCKKYLFITPNDIEDPTADCIILPSLDDLHTFEWNNKTWRIEDIIEGLMANNSNVARLSLKELV
jgi:hypothetical protein